MIADDQRRTSQIVAAYVRRNPIPTDQIGGLVLIDPRRSGPP